MLGRFLSKLASRYPTVNLMVTQQYDVPLRITYSEGRFTLHFAGSKAVNLNIGEMQDLIKKIEGMNATVNIKTSTSRAELQTYNSKLTIVLDERYTIIGNPTEILLSLKSIAIAAGVTL